MATCGGVLMGTVGIKKLEARLARLAAQGRVTLPSQAPLKRVRTVKASGKPTSRIILEDRR